MCTKTPASQPIPPPYYKTCRNRSIILMLLDTGIRLSECASLSLSDINLEAGIIRVWGKGGKQRLSKLGRTALEALRVYLELRGCPTQRRPCGWARQGGL